MLPCDDLWSHPVRRSDHRGALVLLRSDLSTEAKVGCVGRGERGEIERRRRGRRRREEEEREEGEREEGERGGKERGKKQKGRREGEEDGQDEERR